MKSVEQQVLEYITYKSVDFAQIGKVVATTYPAIFMMIVNDGAEYKELIRQGNIVSAIKLRRENNGEGLKEAKDFIDKVRNQMRLEGENV